MLTKVQNLLAYQQNTFAFGHLQTNIIMAKTESNYIQNITYYSVVNTRNL